MSLSPASGPTLPSDAFDQSDEFSFDEICSASLADQKKRGLLRELKIVAPLDATHLEYEGKRYVDFASNNYLGLTHHPKMIAAVRDAAEKYGVGSGAAALISGYTSEHAAAEREIAQWKQCESALLLPSGYQANLAAVQTLASLASARANQNGQPPRFLVDQSAHASLLDAVRASSMSWRIFPHNQLRKLARLLSDAPTGQMQVVVTESIFSMDGDAADLTGLAKLKQQFAFNLLLDEAHGTGAYGTSGRGNAEESGHSDIADISILTLSKAMGAAGGAICGSAAFINAVINFGRAAIFTTSIPPAVAAASRAAIQIMRDEPARQRRLRASARKVRAALAAGEPTDSPIIPIILGDESAALQAAEKLREAGMWVIAVRPPTVRRGTSRLRITISSEHTDEEIDRLIQNLKAML